ncbi:MAG: PhnD/SsuA/transferrin family substrate-binding protein [Oscillospiraceae bacterium]|nr:PhnD/SsuA/transferrin family substrate-binding protein [Oscillospiraceae bacterium]
MSEYLGIPVEEYHGDDYSAVVEAMRTGAAQIASFGPFSYVHAAERSGAECFAVQANNGTSGYYSLIIAGKGSGIESLDERHRLYAVGIFPGVPLRRGHDGCHNSRGVRLCR